LGPAAAAGQVTVRGVMEELGEGHQPAPVAPQPTEAMEERRHVTVMFYDLVDRVALKRRRGRRALARDPFRVIPRWVSFRRDDKEIWLP
jgi:class 3 adenylate cyclase